MDTEREYTIEELAAQVGVPVRTIRYYIAQGLLPGSRGRGKAATYDEEHLLRLQLIRRLVEQRVPLAEVRARVAHLAPGEVRVLLSEEEERAARLEEASSPRAYLAELLSRARAAAEAPAAAPVPSLREDTVFCIQLPAEPRSERWERLELAPGVELHIRSDARRRHRRLIERLLQAAGATPGE